VVLVGPPGAGKTTVGRVLARRLGLGFTDVDALIVERAGKSIAEVFTEDGEDAFRALERAVVAEALTNVAKYANAKRATVRIMRADGQASIEVSDDGVGGADPLGGTGLRGLADRIEALDGTLAVESNGSGTCVSAVIPCE